MDERIEEEILHAEEILNEHPVLSYSPGDLSRLGKSVEMYLAQWPAGEKELWIEYYEDELPRRKIRTDLFEIASAFRTAIDDAVRAGEIREMMSFPRGCCSFASDLLQRYLIEEYGLFTFYMSGRYGYGEEGESHAWLETENGTVIDITGDQYKYNKLKFVEPVYIGSRADGFHDKFELDEPVVYFRDEDPFGRNREFDRRYAAVLKHLDQTRFYG